MEKTEVTITLTLAQIQTLNNFLTYSTPTVSYGVASQFVTDISAQIQKQLIPEDRKDPQPKEGLSVDDSKVVRMIEKEKGQ